MKLLLETSLGDLFIALMNDHEIIAHTHIPNLQKKADALPYEVQKILTNNNVEMSIIDSFYVTLGPGSFMGARTALIYAKTICQINKCKLFTATTLDFISVQATPFIDAKGGQTYALINSKPSLIDFHDSTIIDYSDIITNVQKYLNVFIEQGDITNIKPCYVKDPRIGGV